MLLRGPQVNNMPSKSHVIALLKCRCHQLLNREFVISCDNDVREQSNSWFLIFVSHTLSRQFILYLCILNKVLFKHYKAVLHGCQNWDFE